MKATCGNFPGPKVHQLTNIKHQDVCALQFAPEAYFFQMQIGRVEEEKLQRKIKCLKTPWKKTILVWLGGLSQCMVIYLHFMVNGIGRSAWGTRVANRWRWSVLQRCFTVGRWAIFRVRSSGNHKLGAMFKVGAIFKDNYSWCKKSQTRWYLCRIF